MLVSEVMEELSKGDLHSLRSQSHFTFEHSCIRVHSPGVKPTLQPNELDYELQAGRNFNTTLGRFHRLRLISTATRSYDQASRTNLGYFGIHSNKPLAPSGTTQPPREGYSISLPFPQRTKTRNVISPTARSNYSRHFDFAAIQLFATKLELRKQS